MSDYPPFLQELLNSCPKRPAKGLHPWLFRTARYLHRYHSADEILAILSERVADCGRYVEPHEIPDAIKNSGAYQWEPKTASQRRAEWIANPTWSRRVPDFNPELARQRAARIPIDITPAWLKAHSPQPVDCTPSEFLPMVFKPAEKVVVFTLFHSQGHLWPSRFPLDRFAQAHLSDGMWFLCNPVDGETHFNPRRNKKSQRSEESITSFRYGVLECDQEPREQWGPIWLNILAGLELPIVAITDSGKASYHALVRGNCSSKQAWDAWKLDLLRPLVAQGADDGALSAVRLTRLPNAYRGDCWQELLYLNPAADGTPIFYQGQQ